MTVVEMWTGLSASALRKAMRLTNEKFAEKLGTSLRAVTKWNADPAVVPSAEVQRRLDKLLHTSSPDVHERFDALHVPDAPQAPRVPEPRRRAPARSDVPNAGELRLAHDPAASHVLSWLDRAAGWADGAARTRIANGLKGIDGRVWRDAAQARALVGRSEIADALGPVPWITDRVA